MLPAPLAAAPWAESRFSFSPILLSGGGVGAGRVGGVGGIGFGVGEALGVGSCFAIKRMD